MYIDGQTIITIGGLITAIGLIIGVFVKAHNWYIEQENQGKEIKELREVHMNDMNGVAEETELICFALSACLDGLQQLGCNHTVPEAKTKLDKFLNNRAHSIKEK